MRTNAVLYCGQPPSSVNGQKRLLGQCYFNSYIWISPVNNKIATIARIGTNRCTHLSTTQCKQFYTNKSTQIILDHTHNMG